MKKILALLALVLGMVSCQTEPEGLDVIVGGEVDTVVTVTIPEAETRATDSAEGAFKNVDLTGDATIRYILKIYQKVGNEYVASNDRQVKYSDGTEVAFPVRLVPNRDYRFVVWADYVKGEADVDYHYNTADLTNIKLNGEWNAMDETRDAFTGVYCTVEAGKQYTGTSSINILLKRPFAKLRVITTDMEQLNDLNIKPTKATVEYTVDHYNAFNALVGEAIGDSKNRNIKHEDFVIKPYGDNVNDESMVLFTDYFFANNDVVQFNLTVVDQNGAVIDDTIAFNTDINVKRNHLTTITGNILTDSNNVNVIVDPAFDGHYTVPSEVSELVNVINSAADNVETIIPVNEDIELPEALTIPAGKNIVLDFAANTTLTGTLVVEDGAKLTVNNGTIENADKSLSGITSNGKLTLNNVEIKSARHAVRVESGDVVIYGGTFEVVPVSASTLHALNVGDDGKSATVIIKGGTFRGPKGTIADSGSAVNVRNGSTVIIEGGNFSGGKNKTLSAAAGATLIVKGGLFDQDPSAFVATDYTTINMNTTRSATKEYVYAVMKGSEENGYYNILIEDTAALDFFAEVVDYGYTFAGDVVKLANDIDCFKGYMEDGDPISTNPIGRRDYTKETYAFCGTFDGDGHSIKNLYQNGWALGYESGVYGAIGLFSKVQNATIKNLTMDGCEMFVEGGNVAVIAGNAEGDCTFENITIKNSTVCSYNNGVAGIVAWSETGNYTFKNIVLEDTFTVASFWGAHGTYLGGVVAEVYADCSYKFEDIVINCRLDAHNDVVSNYQWYAYRCGGMIAGNVETTQEINGTVYPNPAGCNITCSNVTVNYGDWMNYHYCESPSYGTPSYADEGEWKFHRVEPGYSWAGVDHANCNHGENESHYVYIPFDQLFGGGQNGSGHNPVYGLREYAGVTVNYPASYRREVSTTAQLTEALNKGLSVVLESDIDFGSTQLAITGENQVVDLGGHTLTTANNWGGISLKNGAAIKNGTITHSGNTAAIKVFNGSSVENVTINATCSTADKTVTGIAVQQGANVESIKNVTINGVSQGIEVGYQATVGLIENAVVNESNNGTAKGIGLVINGGKVGLAKNCTFIGATYGITLHLKGVFAAGLELQNCVVEGTTAAIYAWDEKGISNTSGSLVLTYDDATEQKSGANFIVADFEEECASVVSIAKK